MLEDHLQIFLLAVFLRIVDRFRAGGNPNDVSFGVEDGCPAGSSAEVCRDAHHGDPTVALSADEIARNPSFTQGIETLFGMADEILSLLHI